MEDRAHLRGLAHAILTCVTAGPGLGFNRAVLFLADEQERTLEVATAVGPVTGEEARTTWARLARDHPPLDDLLRGPPDAADGIEPLVASLAISLAAPDGSDGNPVVEAFRTRRVVKTSDPVRLDRLPPKLREIFGGTEIVCVPLQAKEHAIGVIVADDAFSGLPIDDHRVRLLQLLALLAGLAIENARMYARLEGEARRQEAILQELTLTQDRLLHSERLATVGSVVARVSHEIRNPLATIGGFARALARRPADAERVARDAAIIADEVTKLEALLKEMLDFTSPRPPQREPADLNRLVARFADLHRDEVAALGATLVLELAPDLPAVSIDVWQVERVLLNLWQNALQALDAAPAGARELRLGTAREDGGVALRVADTGIGIPVEARDHLFQPFFTTKPRGTGLGLAVVKKIVDDHHGTTQVRSDRAGGTTFVVTLPLGR